MKYKHDSNIIINEVSCRAVHAELSSVGGVEHKGGGDSNWYAAAPLAQDAPDTVSAVDMNGVRRVARRVALTWESSYKYGSLGRRSYRVYSVPLASEHW